MPEDDAKVEIKLNGDTTIPNGTAAAWAAGENTLSVVVTNGGASKVYTVTVSKS